MQQVRCVLVGDKGVGKTSCLITYIFNAFPSGYCPAKYDDGHAPFNVMVNGKEIQVSFSDTLVEETVKLRSLEYANADVVLICFDVTSRESFENIKTFWIKEINTYCKHIPYLLVGLKTDLRDKFYSDMDDKVIRLNNKKSNDLVFGYLRFYFNSIVIPKDVMNICCEYYYEPIPITTDEGMELIEEIKAKQYIELSAWTQEGLKNLFDQAFIEGAQKKIKKKKQCCIM